MWREAWGVRMEHMFRNALLALLEAASDASRCFSERYIFFLLRPYCSVFAPSIVYDRDDPWVTLLRRLALLPMLPISGDGDALYQPIWAHDVARTVLGWVEGRGGSRDRYELAGPQVLSYDDMARTVAAAAGRPRPLLHVPLPLVRSGLIWLRRLVGENAFATWEEAELMEIPMTTARGTSDAEALGVEPLAMREALGAGR